MAEKRTPVLIKKPNSYPVSATKYVRYKPGDTAVLYGDLFAYVATDQVEIVTPAMKPVADIGGIGDEIAQALADKGFVTQADLRSASDEELLAVPGIGKAKLAVIRAALED